MITITQDAEFMVNLVSANPIPAGNRFFAFIDENLNPAVLSHSEDNKLNLVLEVDGIAQLFDFGDICGLDGNVQAFALLQDSDLNVWIAVATDAGNDQSYLYLIIDLQPSDLLDPPDANIIKTSDKFSEIHGMYMSNFTRTVGSLLFPLLFVAFQPLDRITKEDQLGYVDITVDSDGNTDISLDTSWSLATNPLKILDVSFGECRLGKGAFVLYEVTGDALKLQFRVFEGRNFSVELDAPSGAACLTAYYDNTAKSTVFLVGGDVITQYKYADYNKSSGTGTTIVTGSNSTLEIEDIHNAQSGDSITVWYTTATDAAFYYSASTSSMSDGLLVQLLPDGGGGQISELLSSKDDNDLLVNTLLSVDEMGDLIILQQASDTGMWESHPFYIPATTDNIDIPSFTVRIKAHTNLTSPDEKVSGCGLYVSSSGFLRAKCNGLTITLDQNGAWYQADHTGTLTIIVTTADMTCPTIQVAKFQAQGYDQVTLTVPVLIPSSKLNEKLAGISSGQDLLDATTQSGEQLIEPGTVSQEDADTAASMISELNKAQITMGQPADAGQPGPKLSTSALRVQRRVVRIAGRLSGGFRAADTSNSDSSPWDFFMFLYEKAEEVASWVLQTVDDVLQFVIKWADEVYCFVLDTIEAIGKALSWVFAKIKVGVNKLIDFVGFIFKWDDILQFSDSIVTYVNACFGYGVDQINALEDKALTFIDDLRQQLKDRVQPDSVSANTNTNDGSDTSDTEGVRHGVGYNWSTYQLNHGGFQKDSPMTAPSISSSDQDTLSNIWDSLVNEINDIANTVNSLASTLSTSFDGNTTSAELFNQVTDNLIDLLCDSLQNVVNIILDSIILILQEIDDLGNYAIEIPVFTALWKVISEGRDFTAYNFIALVLAIPATVLYKLISNSPLPALAGQLTKDDFGKFIAGDSSLDSTLAQDIQLVRSVSIGVVGYVLFEVTALTFAIDEVAGDVASTNAVTTVRRGKLAGPIVRVSDDAGNIIDTATLILTGFSLYFTWPLNYGHDVDLHAWVWGLDLSNGIFLAVSRLVGWRMEEEIRRVDTKRFVGLYELATAYPIFILDLIIAVHEYELPDDDPDKNDALTTRHVVEDVFQLISCGGFCVAAVFDEVQTEVSAVGLAVFGLSLTLKFTFVFVDLFLKYTA